MRGETGGRSCVLARRAAALAFSLALALASGRAHGADAKPDLDLLDRYLDRAEEARTQAEWSSLSDSGEAAVLARWESTMLSLSDAGVDYAALRKEAESEIKGEIERRLSAWLMDRFFSSVGDVDLTGLLNGMKRSTIAAIFELDGHGAVRLDAEGDPIQRELSGDAAFETELGAWKSSSRGLEDQAIADWETRSTEAFGELLAGLSPSARSGLQASGTARLADYGASLRREADAMLALEESNYRYLRLKDQYSLRLESEGASASSVVDSLVEKTQASLDAGLKNLTDGLDAEVGEVSVNGEPIDGDEWQERFRDELDNGLALWEKAGEDFIARRVEWEQRAGKDLSSGIAEWNDALRELQERESEWLDQFQTVRERAETQYDQRFAEIEQAQSQAKAELDSSVAANEGNLTERIEVMVGALDQSLEMMKTARESAGYWIAKTGGNAGFSIDAVSWDANALRKELLSSMFACSISRLDSSAYGSFPSEGSLGSMGLAFLSADVRAMREFHTYITDENSLMPSSKELESLVARGASGETLTDYAGYTQAVTDYYREKLSAKAEDIYQETVESRLTDAEKAILSGNLSAFVGETLDRLSGALAVSGDARGDDGEALSQATYWVEAVYRKYAAEAEGQNAELAKSYGLIVFEGKDIPSSGYSSGQTIAGPIEALDARGWESIYLDSYQVELLQARAVGDYWAKELAVAKAVYDYSVDESSARQTEAETLQGYQAAYDGYTAALSAYQGAVAELGAINVALDEKNAAIDAIKTRLGAAKDKLAKAKTRYADLLALAELNNADYYTGQFRSYYEAIGRLRGSGSGSVSESAAKLASSAAAYANETFVKVSSDALGKLIHGDATADAGAEGIIDIKRQYDARVAFSVDSSKFGDSTFLADMAKDLALSEGDPWYTTIKKAYENHGALAMDAAGARDFSRFLESVSATLAAEASGTLEKRMMEVSLLLSGTPSDAYGAVAKLTQGAARASSVSETKTLLEENERGAKRALLVKRLDVELPALERLIAEMDSYKAAHGESLAGFSADIPGNEPDPSADLSWTLWHILGADKRVAVEGIASDVAECRDALTAIKSIMSAVAGADEQQRALRALAASDRFAAEYLSGKTAFSSGGVDYSIRYLSGEYAATVALSGAAAAYGSYAALSPGLQSTLRSADVSTFSSWVSSNRLGSVSGGVFDLKSPVALWQSFNPASVGDAVEEIARVTQGAEAVLADERLPSYLRQGIGSWLSEFTTLFTYRSAISFGTGAAEGSGALHARAEGLAKDCADFARVSGTFLNPEASSGSRAVAALWLIASGDCLSGTSGDVALDALAASFCADRLARDDAGFPSWESRYEAWFDGLKADDPGDACRASARERIIERAQALWEKAQLKGDAGYDYAASVNKECLDGITLVEALKDSPPECYLALFDENAGAIADDAIALYRVERYLESATDGTRFGVNDAFARLYYGGDAAAASASLPGVMSAETSERKSAYLILCALGSDSGNPAMTTSDAEDLFVPFAARYLASAASSSSLIALATGNGAVTSDTGVTGASGLTDVFSGLYYASLNASLSGYTDSERSGALAILTGATGIAANPAIDLVSFAASGLDGRALAGYACADASRACADAAYEYALKKRVLAGNEITPYLALASEGLKTELARFQRVVSVNSRYIASFDAPFSAYLETIPSADLRESERADASLFNALGWFRDPYFETAPGATGTKDYLDVESARLSDGLTALAAAAESALAAEFEKRSTAASLAGARSAAASAYERLSVAEDGAWRSYLGSEGIMTHVKDAALLDDTALAFTACEAVTDLQEETGGKCVYYSANAEVNNGLESAQRLSALSSALESWFGAWYASGPSGAASAYVRANSDLAAADPRSGSLSPAFESFKGIGVSSATASAYQKDAQEYGGRIGQQTALSKSMANLGETVAEFNANKNRSTAAMTSAAKDRITALQAEIGAIEAEWAKAIDDPSMPAEALTAATFALSGYRQLESVYDLRYATAQQSFARLEAAKQASKTAKAIYDYASTPYLRPTDELPSEDGSNALAALQNVDPDTRLAAVRDHVRRAAAAVSALETLYDDQDQAKTLFDRDPEYARLKSAYGDEYRARLATLQAQTLLETEIKNDQAQYDRAKGSFESTAQSADNARTVFAETDADGACTVTVHDWLTGLRDSLASDQLKSMFDELRISGSEVSFSGSGSPDETAIAGYFTRGKDEPLSEFEKDLASWMERNSSVDVGLWTNALSWEEFTRAGGLTRAEFSANIPENSNQGQYLGQYTLPRSSYGLFICGKLKQTLLAEFGGKDGDEDLDKAISSYCGAMFGNVGTLIQGLKDAYDQVASSGDYAFFKMITLYNAAKFDSGGTMISFLNSTFAQEFYAEARDGCQHSGTNSWFHKPEWHDARDDADAKRGEAFRLYHENNGYLNATGMTIALAEKKVAEAKASLMALIGVDPESGVGSVSFDGLVSAIVAASRRNGSSPLDDILKTARAGDVPSLSAAQKEAALRRVLSSSGSVATSGSYRSMNDILGSLAAAHDDLVESADESLSTYLRAGGSASGKSGLAVTQEKNEGSYGEAYTDFVARGIIPDAVATKNVVAGWKAILAANVADPEAGIGAIANAAKEYLAMKQETETEDSAIRDLRLAWTAYRKALETGAGKAEPERTLVKTFSDLASGYEAGAAYAIALAAAYDWRGETATSGHVYDERENTIRAYELYKGILEDLSSEESAARVVGLDDVTASLKETLLTMNAARLASYAEVRMGEWDILRQELAEEKAHYEAQMDAILSRGRYEWRKGVRTMAVAQETWEESFGRDFTAKGCLWDDRYLAFLDRKDEWATDLVAQAVNVGDKAILGRVPELTADYIGEANDFIVSDVIERPNPSCIIRDVLDEDLLSGLLDGGKTLSGGIAGFTPVIFQTLKRDTFTNAEILDRVREYQTRNDDELQARLAFIQYDKAHETLKDARSEVEESVKDSNKSAWKGFRDMLLDDGFKLNGENFTKKTTVGATLLDNLYETHTIKGFSDFTTDVRDFAKDFAIPEGISPQTLGFDALQALLKKAMDSVPKEYNRIYGERDTDGNWIGATYERQYIGEEPYDDAKVRYDAATQQYVSDLVKKTREVSASDTTITADAYKQYQEELTKLGAEEQNARGSRERMLVRGNGQFNEWVGYAPVMKGDADTDVPIEDYVKNVQFAGSGETGRIMGMYIQHKMIEGAGQAEARQPAYNRRLWDDRGSWFAAPNMRTLTDIAMSIAAGIIAPGMGNLLLNMALNMVDDAVFMTMDMGNGLDAGSALSAFAKKASTSVVTSRIGAGFSKAGGLLSSNMFGSASGAVGPTLTKGLEITATNTASSAINAFSARSLMEGEDCFDEDAFGESAFGTGAMASVAAGMAGNAVATGLGKWDMTDANKSWLNNFTFDTANIQRYNNFMGSMVGSAVTYGLTGNAKFNVARINGVGLMELNLGKDGFGMNMGMNGTDISLGTLSSAMSGYREAHKVLSWKFGSNEQQSTLNGINMMGWTGVLGNAQNVGVSRAIWSGELKARYEKMAEGDNGYYDRDVNANEIVLSSAFLGSGSETAAKLATVMSHEGSHWSGNHIEALAQAQGMTTYGEINALFGLAGDSQFSQTMADAYSDPESWQVNDSSRDYWRVTKDKDGKVLKIENDGSNSVTTVDENGVQTGFAEYVTGTSRTDLLGKQIGLTADETNTMLIAAGYSLNKSTGLFEGENAKSAFDITGTQTLLPGNMNATSVFYYQQVQGLKHEYVNTLKRTEATNDEIVSAIDRVEAVLGLPYGSEGRTFDENRIVQNTSTTIDCTGLVSLGYKTPANHTAENFGDNPYFTDINNLNDTTPKAGDIMQIIYTANQQEGHVMIYLGSNGPLRDQTGKKYEDQIIEAYSYIDEQGNETGHVRYNRYSSFKASLARLKWDINSVNYYRRNKYGN